MKRTILAFLLAPSASPVITTLQFGRFHPGLMAATLSVAYLVLAVCGLPVFYAFYRLGWRSWWQFLGAGVFACCLFLIYSYFETPPSEFDLAHTVQWSMRFIVHAAIAALVFWFVAIRPRRVTPHVEAA